MLRSPSGLPMTPEPATAAQETRKGLLYGFAAYGFWGVIPVYWRMLGHVDPVEVLAHRMVWGLVALLGLSAVLGAGPDLRAALRDRRTLLTLAGTGALLAANWGVFVYAVGSGHLLEASLGYFINPLLSVLLGALVLGERLGRSRQIALGLATVGVGLRAWSTGGLPWISLALAVTFGVYGLLRKTARVPALAGSTLETGIVAPLGLAFLAHRAMEGQGALGHATQETQLLLLGTGLITVLPLVWFSAAARRLPLSTVGFLQYIAPTLQFFSAVLWWGEPFAPRDLGAFLCIWAGLAIFAVAR